MDINIVNDVSGKQFQITEIYVTEFKKGSYRFHYKTNFWEINWQKVEVRPEKNNNKRNTTQQTVSQITRQAS